MQNYVFVIDQHKKQLDPVHPRRARRLLEKGRAAIFRMFPFTIILKRVIDNPIVQQCQIKIDPGSKITGFALVRNGEVIWGMELEHRGEQIKSKLLERRSIRRNRRNRKTRYRQPRFLNRKRPDGWLPPSLKHRVETIETWVIRLMRFAPTNEIAYEQVKFDMQKMQKPDISEEEYQRGTLHGYEVREYLLEKWDRKCTYCNKKDIPLQIEHIHPKSKGGSNRISNLCLACDKCNKKKGDKSVEDFLKNQSSLLQRIKLQLKKPLKDAAAVNTTRKAIVKMLSSYDLFHEIKTSTGAQTKYNRIRLNFKKEHWIDAACVGDVDRLILKTNQPLRVKCNGHGTRQMCRTDKYGFPSRYAPRNKSVYGFQTGDIVKAVVSKGKKIGTYFGRIAVRKSGSFNISSKSGLVQGINHKYCKFIQKKDGYSYSF